MFPTLCPPVFLTLCSRTRLSLSFRPSFTGNGQFKEAYGRGAILARLRGSPVLAANLLLCPQFLLRPPISPSFIMAWSLWRRQHQINAAIARLRAPLKCGADTSRPPRLGHRSSKHLKAVIPGVNRPHPHQRPRRSIRIQHTRIVREQVLDECLLSMIAHNGTAIEDSAIQVRRCASPYPLSHNGGTSSAKANTSLGSAVRVFLRDKTQRFHSQEFI